MKRIFLTLWVLTLMSSADYEIYTMMTKKIGIPVTKEELFFGELGDFSEKMEEIGKSITAHGAEGALIGLSAGSESLAKGIMEDGMKSGLAGLGIGIVIGALDAPIMELYADQKIMQVLRVVDSKGNVAYEKRFIVCDKHPSLSLEEARKIIETEVK
ncbi:MAG: hypothetical protein LHW56_11305 [Candidatus Cloacimonetes bacterium]|nr:hypothetical protein [Candidatus Cloacimonadota bacterium]MDD2451112.1 hypothetical protein [Sulfurovum sp.]MDD3499671.1 hypothetical protein [Sulfurovum sp.]MDY0173478.1 hypothetical protein [Candidatus Cloacimonadaceae bacterium]